MSQTPRPWFTDTEIRFLNILCDPHAAPMPAALWQTIIDRFYEEQVRHLRGGELYHLDPWPRRVRVSHVILTDPRLAVGENFEEEQAIETLLGVVNDPEQRQPHEQANGQPQEGERLRLPEGSIRLPAGNIRLPEGSILLPDRSILFPDGRLLLTNAPSQAAPIISLPDGRIRLPNGRTYRASSSIERPACRPNVRFRNGRAHLPDGTMVPRIPRPPPTPMSFTPSRAPAPRMVPRTPEIRPIVPHPSFGVDDDRFRLRSPALPPRSDSLHGGWLRLPSPSPAIPSGSDSLHDGWLRLPSPAIPSGSPPPHGGRAPFSSGGNPSINVSTPLSSYTFYSPCSSSSSSSASK